LRHHAISLAQGRKLSTSWCISTVHCALVRVLWQGYLPDMVKKGKKAKKPEGTAPPPAKKIKA